MSARLPLTLFGLVACACGWIVAGETSKLSSDSSALIQDALRAELEGTQARRSALLQQAFENDPNNPAVRWHKGYIEQGGRWTPFVAAGTQIDPSSNVGKYASVRSRFGNTYKDQLELAGWCKRHNLPEKQRAHLTRALELSGDPNHPLIRSRLGFERVDGRWINRAQAAQSKREARNELQLFGIWKSKLETIAGGLGSNRTKTREAALARLNAIDDPGALPAMEAVLSTHDMQTAHLMLDVYANMQSHQATGALARQAVFSPWVTVRTAAAEKLRSSPPEEYASELMSLLNTPIQSKLDVYLRDRTLNLTRTLLRETWDSQQVAVLESATQFVASGILPIGASRGSPQQVRKARELATYINRYHLLDTDISIKLRENRLGSRPLNREIEKQNAETQWLNDRVCTALSTSTGVVLPADPASWWQWWLDYNDLYEVDEKPREYTYAREVSVQVVPVLAAQIYASCLAAGTLVWTDRGPLPVESVQVGDLALSKHPETGELAYKPVLRTTVRPAESLHKVTLDGDSFMATGGHTFWISGKGWLKVRDVQPGMRFHGATGPVELAQTEEVEGQPVYNLVVADFHTYFVGPSMILSHDPTFAEPTDRLVPGLEVTYAAR